VSHVPDVVESGPGYILPDAVLFADLTEGQRFGGVEADVS